MTDPGGTLRERLLELLDTVATANADYMLSEIKVDIPSGQYPRQYLQPAAASLLQELRETATALTPETSAVSGSPEKSALVPLPDVAAAMQGCINCGCWDYLRTHFRQELAASRPEKD